MYVVAFLDVLELSSLSGLFGKPELRVLELVKPTETEEQGFLRSGQY